MTTSSTPRTEFNNVMVELKEEVAYCLANAYVLVKGEDDFRAKLYYNAHMWPYDGSCCLDCESEKYGRCVGCNEEEYDVRDVWTLWKENGAMWNKCEVGRRYREMSRYDAIDAFLTERVKNSICEDNLGDIFSFL